MKEFTEKKYENKKAVNEEKIKPMKQIKKPKCKIGITAPKRECVVYL
jgi:hypothetical protein